MLRVSAARGHRAGKNAAVLDLPVELGAGARRGCGHGHGHGVRCVTVILQSCLCICALIGGGRLLTFLARALACLLEAPPEALRRRTDHLELTAVTSPRRRKDSRSAAEMFAPCLQRSMHVVHDLPAINPASFATTRAATCTEHPKARYRNRRRRPPQKPCLPRRSCIPVLPIAKTEQRNGPVASTDITAGKSRLHTVGQVLLA